MSSIFTKIINREIPCHLVAEDKKFIAFLDINPLVLGHTLVVPKREIDYIFDLDERAFAALHLFSKKVANAMEQAIPCIRIGTAVIGLEVPHAHIHLIPISSMDDMDFSKPKLNPTQEELTKMAADISLRFN